MAIGLVALGFRLAFILQYTAHPLGRLPWVDEEAYWDRAQAIVAGAWLPPRPYFQDPLFSYVLAGLIALVGPNVARVRVALACVGALSPVCLYWAGRRGLGRGEAIAAGCLAAACSPWVFTDGQLGKEGLAALIGALALVVTAGAANGRTRAAGEAGAAWGLVALLRSNALAIAPLGAAWLAACAPKGRRVRPAAVWLVGFTVVLAPVTVVNAVVSRPRQLILTTWQAGANFYIGNGPEANGIYAAPRFVTANPAFEADNFADEASRRAGRRLTEAEVSRFWFSAGLKRWYAAPLASLELLAWKVALLVNDREVPDNQDLDAVSLLAAPAVEWPQVSFGVLLPLAVLGGARRERTPFWWFLVLSTGVGLATTVLFFIVGRYRVPWFPGLTLLAACGLVDAFRAVADRRFLSLGARLALLGIPAAVVSWWPLDDPAPDRWGHQEPILALAYLADGQLDPAVDAFDDAQSLGPQPAARVRALLAPGQVHDRLAELISARRQVKPSPGVAPEVELARWSRQLPETRAESRRLLDDRLSAAPDDRAARRESGAWWLGEADPVRARSELALAVADPSPDPSASILLALLSNDPSRLPEASALATEPQRTRLRLARALLAARRQSRPSINPARGRSQRAVGGGLQGAGIPGGPSNL